MILYWEDSYRGRHVLNTASVLLTRTEYIREVKRYSCLATKQVRTPVAVYSPSNNYHFLLWQELSGFGVIGGELLQGQFLEFKVSTYSVVETYHTLNLTASLGVVAQRYLWGRALRDDTKNGYVADYPAPDSYQVTTYSFTQQNMERKSDAHKGAWEAFFFLTSIDARRTH